MKTLLKNANVINVFTDEIVRQDVLISDGFVIGIGDYGNETADEIRDLDGCWICPGFIDGHIHIESTMLLPEEFARVCLPHGTTAVITDPHEIANVCGMDGIRFMLEASEGLPVTQYIMLPSCVPATAFDESYNSLKADNLKPFYTHPRVLGLAEMMNYPGVLSGDHDTLEKIRDASDAGAIINGHAPLLSGHDLDHYISCGISDDHECTTAAEGIERIRKGQMLMIRQGTAARDLEAMMPLFREPWNRRCMLVTDDKHPADLLLNGHIDSIIRQAILQGASPVVAIRMATIQAAVYFGLRRIGAVAPGYRADILVLDDLDTVSVMDVYKDGKLVARNHKALPFRSPEVSDELLDAVQNTMHLDPLEPDDFLLKPESDQCRVIRIIPSQLLTEEWITDIDWQKNNGIDIDRDIIKLSVIERHHFTGHMGLGFVSGLGLKRGAIASSVSHDSHNLIIAGTNEEDMALAANEIQARGGGCIAVADGRILAVNELPVAGLMSMDDASNAARSNELLRAVTHRELAVADNIEPHMNLAFLSLPVIPSLKMTTLGLVDVNKQRIVSLYIK